MTDPEVDASSQRLFFALWPEDEVRRQIYRTAQRVTPQGRGQPVANDNLHLTLAFLGAVDAAQQDCLKAAAVGIAAAPFSLQLDRLGHWRRSEILWLACRKPPAPLLQLAEALRAAAQACGIDVDSRPYMPHVSLVRRLRKVTILPEIGPINWPAGDFALVKSDTLPTGVHYTVLQRWPLG
jgi:2'-5' RNA ligase